MRGSAALRALAAAAVALACLAAADDGDDPTCNADGSGEACGGDGEAVGAAAAIAAAVAAMKRAPAPAVRVPTSQASLIAQEVDALKGVIETSQERIRLLTELQEALASGKELPIPESHIRALRENMPLLSEVAGEVGRTVPTAAAEDYLVTKAVIPLDEEARFVRFMPLRNSRGSASSTSSSSHSSNAAPLPSALLVTAREDGAVRLFTPAGELALAFSAGHDTPITHISVAPSHEEYLLATSDSGGVIRLHRVSVRPRRLTKEEKTARRTSSGDKVSQHLGSALNVTVQLQKQMMVPGSGDGESARITALALASQGGNKYLLAGDAAGRVSVFTRNGTLRGQIDATLSPGMGVDSLSATTGSTIFVSGRDWGYLELDKMGVTHMECPTLSGEVTEVILDSQMSTRVIAADDHGTVWIFGTKNKRECRVELQYAQGATRAPIHLASTRGYIIGFEPSSPGGGLSSVVALNMSSLLRAKPATGKGPETVPPPPEHSVVWRKVRPAARAWAMHKRVKEGDLLAFLSEEGREVEVIELFMQAQAPPPPDSFGNFKMPVIAVAVVLVLGYQYLKQKNKGGGGGGGGANPFAALTGAGGGRGKFDFGEDFASKLKNRRNLGGLKGKKF